MNYSIPGSSVHGILQARILEWVAIPFYSESSWLKGQTGVSSIAGRFYTTREGPQLSISSVQLLSRVWLFATPWTVAHQASLSITNFWSLLKLRSIESVIPSNNLILCRPLLLLLLISPSIRIFSSESVLHVYNARIFPMSVLETFESSF